jgi:acyl-coenzyme A thioesterase PaaI-like protein
MVTIDMTVSFMRPSTGKLIIEGKLLKAGKNINYCEGEVINEVGVVTAKALGSFMMRR